MQEGEGFPRPLTSRESAWLDFILPADRPGYREFRSYIEGASTLEEAVQRLKYDTHAFARRQPNWFRRLPNVTKLAADAPDLAAKAVEWWNDTA